jgi:hypothetical protein
VSDIALNNGQQQAVKRVAEILGEHFPTYIVAVTVPDSQDADAGKETMRFFFGGGYFAARGLADTLKQRISDFCEPTRTPEDQP